MNNTKTIFAENGKKGAYVGRMIHGLHFYDRRMKRLELQGEIVLDKCEDVKRKFLTFYDTTKRNKLQAIKQESRNHKVLD